MSDDPLEKETRRGTTHCAVRRARIIAIIYDDVFLETRTIFLGFLTRKVSLSISLLDAVTRLLWGIGGVFSVSH